MIIWSGLGIIIPVLFIVLSILFGADQKTPNQEKEFAYTALVTGLICSALGWWLRNRPGRLLIDKATGREIILRRRHSLFFIPMFYWGLALVAVGIYLYITTSMKH